jgi:hypothetical protein
MFVSFLRRLDPAAPATVIAVSCTVLLPTIGAAQSSQPGAHTKVEPAQTERRLPPPPPADLYSFGIVRQDLYDRNNPNNRRHDYPPPPAQPGQF